MAAHSICRRSVSLILLLLLAVFAAAQTGTHYPTIEALVSPAQSVYTGTILKVEKKVIVDENGRKPGDNRIYPDGYSSYKLTVEVGEVLKGNPEKVVTLELESQGFDKRWEEWSDEKTQFLWMSGPGDPDKWGAVRYYTHPADPIKAPLRWLAVRLGPASKSESWLVGQLTLPMLSTDLSVVRKPEHLLDRIKTFLKANPNSFETCQVNVPASIVLQAGLHAGIYCIAYLPICSAETLARRLIQHPESFVPPMIVPGETDPKKKKYLENVKKSEYSDFRLDGMELLSLFKSDQNIELLKPFLKDTVIWGYTRPGNKGDESGYEYALRKKAYEILSEWGVSVKRPVITAPKPDGGFKNKYGF